MFPEKSRSVIWRLPSHPLSTKRINTHPLRTHSAFYLHWTRVWLFAQLCLGDSLPLPAHAIPVGLPIKMLCHSIASTSQDWVLGWPYDSRGTNENLPWYLIYLMIEALSSIPNGSHKDTTLGILVFSRNKSMCEREIHACALQLKNFWWKQNPAVVNGLA